MLITLYFIGFTCFIYRVAVASSSIEILHPAHKCMQHFMQPNISLRFKLPSHKKDAALHHVHVNVRSSRHDEVWNYDIPPTPHSTTSTHLVECPSVCEVNVPLTSDVHEISIIEVDRGNNLTLAVATPIYVLTRPVSDTIHSQSILKRQQTLEDIATTQLQQHDISQLYSPLHPSLRMFSVDHLHPLLVRALHQYNVSSQLSAFHSIIEKKAYGIYSVPILSEEFCRQMISELIYAKNFTFLTRPNSMNNYGTILREIGFGNWIDALMQQVIQPLAVVAFPAWNALSLDSEHSFTISYRLGEDTSLDRHMDQSAVTMNICLGINFTGADVIFDQQRDASYNFATSDYLLHAPGQHWHSTDTLLSGERHNMIIWGRSSEFLSSSAEIYTHKCKE